MEIGDRVYYLLEQMLKVKYLPGVIENITPKRIVLKLDDKRGFRSVKHNKVVTEIPQSSLIILNGVLRENLSYRRESDV